MSCRHTDPALCNCEMVTASLHQEVFSSVCPVGAVFTVPHPGQRHFYSALTLSVKLLSKRVGATTSLSLTEHSLASFWSPSSAQHSKPELFDLKRLYVYAQHVLDLQGPGICLEHPSLSEVGVLSGSRTCLRDRRWSLWQSEE